MISRQLEPKIKEAATKYPVVTLTGPRQSGKTTLIRAIFPDNRYFSLEDPEIRRIAIEDPRGFLGQFQNENFVIAELIKRRHHEGREPDLYFWKDSGGHELDILIDLGIKLIPIGVKSGQTISKDFFKGLDYWKKLSGGLTANSALIYAGDMSLNHKDTCHLLLVEFLSYIINIIVLCHYFPREAGSL